MIDDDEIAHSERGPSTAHRWRRCKGSVLKSRGLPNVVGIEAAYGTVFHEVAALCLEFDLDPQGFVGWKLPVDGFGLIEFDQAMADNMLFGLDLARSYMNAPGAEFIVERKVSLRDWVGPGEIGTTDLGIIDIANWRIIGFDWKYGAGVPVSPEDNDQAMLYILGMWSDFAHEKFASHVIETHGEAALEYPWEDDIEVIVIIEQPRAEGGGGVWKTTMGHVLSVGRQIREDAEETLLPGAPIVPGEKQCKFCPAAKHNACEERARYILGLIGSDFDELDTEFVAGAPLTMSPPSVFTPEQRGQVLLNAPLIRDLLDQLHESAYRDALMGRPTPGQKLVEGRRPARKWRDERKAEAILVSEFGEEAHTKTLLSPSAVEEKVGKREFKRRFERAVVSGEPKAILVASTRKKEAIRSVLSDFDDIAEHDDTALV